MDHLVPQVSGRARSLVGAGPRQGILAHSEASGAGASLFRKEFCDLNRKLFLHMPDLTITYAVRQETKHRPG